MTFFVDANVVLYAATAGPYRTPCLRVLEAVAAAEADGRTSPAVLEEVWYVERSGRAGAIEGLAAHAYTVFPPLLPVTDEAFVMALSRRAKDLGPADRVHEGTCLAHGIDVVSRPTPPCRTCGWFVGSIRSTRRHSGVSSPAPDRRRPGAARRGPARPWGGVGSPA